MGFRNFVQTQDLEKYSPLIMKDLYATQTDFAPQISLAGQLVRIDLEGKDIDTRLVSTPNDLAMVMFPPIINQPMTYSDISSSLIQATTVVGPINYGPNSYSRFGVDVASFNNTGSVTFTLQGANKLSYGDVKESDWRNMSNLPFTSSNAIGEYITTFDKIARWVRYTVVAQDGAQMNYAVYTNDVTLDQFVITKTFIIILTDMVERENDMWDIRRKFFDKTYTSLLDSAKYLIDTNYSGKPDIADEETNTGTIKFF